MQENTKLVPYLDYNGSELAAKDFTVTSSTGNLKFKKSDRDPKVTITGKGNFTGTRTENVIVKTKEEMKSAKIAVEFKADAHVYNGKKQILAIAADKNGKGELKVLSASGNVLKENEDFVIKYKNNLNAGKAKVTISGKGGYTGKISKTFKIAPDKNASTVTAKLSTSGDAAYKPGGVKPEITVTAKLDGAERILKSGKDYKVTYTNNKKKGKAKYSVNFIGNYKGRKQIKNHKFKIVEADLGGATGSAADMVYAKKGKYQSTPYVYLNGALLTGKDYTAAYFDGTSDITGQSIELKDGESKVITLKVTGKGNYKGQPAAVLYTVRKASGNEIDLSKAKIYALSENRLLSKKNYSYTGKEIRPAIEVKVNGTTVPASKYDVSYFNNKNRGTAKVFINGRDGAFGSRSSTFRIGAMSLADMLKALGLR